MWYLRSFVESGITVLLWMLVTIMFIGVGRLIVCRRVESPADVPYIYAAGVASVLIFTTTWRFMSAISTLLSIVLVVSGLFGSFLFIRELRSNSLDTWHRILKPEQQGLLIIGVVFFLCCLWRVANDATCYVPQVDAYHMTSIRWAQMFPYIKGLANLEGRLGFNNATTGIHAVFLNVFKDRGFSLLHGSLYLFILTSIVGGLVDLQLSRQSRYLLAWLLVPLAIFTFLFRDVFAIGGVSPDTFVLLGTTGLSVLLVSCWTRITSFHPQEPENALGCSWRMVVCYLCFGTLLTVKLSCLFFIVPLLFGFAATRIPSQKSQMLKRHGILILTFSFPVAIWVMSNIILSGWLAYPAPHTRLELWWSVPLSNGLWEKEHMLDFARHFVEPPETYDKWFFSWLRIVVQTHFVVIVLPFVGVLVFSSILAWPQRKRLLGELAQVATIFFIATVIALAGFFSNAPSPRFLAIPIFASVVILGAITCGTVLVRRGWLVTIVVCSLFGGGVWVHRITQEIEQGKGSVVNSTLETLIQLPPSASGRFSPPNPASSTRLQNSHFRLMRVEGWAWNADLICVTYPYPDMYMYKLKMRNIDRPEEGFFVDQSK